jgi:hypothetical protein
MKIINEAYEIITPTNRDRGRSLNLFHILRIHSNYKKFTQDAHSEPNVRNV